MAESEQPTYVSSNRKSGLAAPLGGSCIKTVDDFGVNGDRPSHPELLDRLASQFIRDGWSAKKLSQDNCSIASFRLSSEAPAYREIDPVNRLVRPLAAPFGSGGNPRRHVCLRRPSLRLQPPSAFSRTRTEDDERCGHIQISHD